MEGKCQRVYFLRFYKSLIVFDFDKLTEGSFRGNCLGKAISVALYTVLFSSLILN